MEKTEEVQNPLTTWQQEKKRAGDRALIRGGENCRIKKVLAPVLKKRGGAEKQFPKGSEAGGKRKDGGVQKKPRKKKKNFSIV